MAAESASENHIDVVLEGGGVKGIGLAGACAALEEAGYVAQNVTFRSGEDAFPPGPGPGARVTAPSTA